MDKMERVACYIRVSHQEQKLYGISLDAQRDKLQEYADNNHLKIVGWYEDEGISGRKLIRRRPALQSMLKDAQKSLFDRIIFIKLDRYFRSVAEYYECQKILETHKVLWTATEEKYDLTTANGRYWVTQKLAMAEYEADQTSERIKLVNDYKVKTGQALTGSHNQGYGFTVQNIDGVKKVVKNPETAHIVEDFIQYYLVHQNKRQAHIYIKDKYNVNVCYNTLTLILKDTKLYGHYRGNDNYVTDPYIDKATFDKLQEIMKNNIKKSGNNRVYLFTGLIKCPVCGCTLTAKFSGGKKTTRRPSGKVYTYYKEYFDYRCNNHHKESACSFNAQPKEPKLEKALLDTFEQYVNASIVEAAISDNRANVDNEKVNNQVKELKGEMERTTKAYRKGRITEAEYDKEYDELETRLKELESQLEPHIERDLTIYEDLLKSDWKSLYNALNKENKRAFWRKYLKGIEVNKDGTFKHPIFF